MFIVESFTTLTGDEAITVAKDSTFTVHHGLFDVSVAWFTCSVLRGSQDFASFDWSEGISRWIWFLLSNEIDVVLVSTWEC
jgi:hypothetical protein